MFRRCVRFSSRSRVWHRPPRSVPARSRAAAGTALCVAASLLLAGSAEAQTEMEILFAEDFTGGLGTFSEAGYVFTGTYGVRMRGGSSDGIVTSPEIPTEGFTDITLSFDRATSGLDGGEAGIASVSIDGGTFQPVESTQSASGRTTIALPPAAGGSSVVIQFNVVASSFFETYEVDNVVLEGVADGEPPPPPPPPPDLGVSGFYLEGGGGATTPDPFRFTNTGSVDVALLMIDLGPGSGSPVFDPGDVPFAVTSADAVGFDGSFALDGSGTVLQLAFADFGPGETFAFAADLDDAPFSFTTGAEVAGSSLTVTGSGGELAVGLFQEDAADPNRANVSAGGGGGPPPPPPPGDVPPIGDFVTFESGQVRPLALSSDGTRLYAVNTPDNRVEVFDVGGAAPLALESIPVGLEPVALALANDGALWVVNHLSDSVSIIDVASSPARVVNTLLVGDEPRDVVFAGTGNRWAFVTAAHRGQNVPFDPQLTTEGVGRADVWVFDTADLGSQLGGSPATILNMFGDTTRALARNASGTRVFAAVFNSGNRTTILTDDIGEGGIDKAPPFSSADGETQPATGLIVQFDGQNWVDSGDPVTGTPPAVWNDRVNLTLPDLDVFEIDTTGSLPTVTGEVSGVGTTLFNMAVNPVSGSVYVSNQEALNLTRFEGSGTRSTTVRGHFAESRVTVIEGSQVEPRHLNKHITSYGDDAGTAAERALSLAQPLGMQVTADGSQLFLVALGSDKIARFDTAALEDDSFFPSSSDQLVLSGGGPTGLVLDEARNRAYVLTRFDNGISVVDTAQMSEVAHVAMFNPEPPVVVDGRRLLYDATLTSSRGDSSCSGCHVFGDMDHLAWDLGDPDGVVTDHPNEYNENIPGFLQNEEQHPMKGPMTTQSLRGLAGNGPMHWRGDRTGASASPGETLEEQAFEDFNVAFVGLLGRGTQLSEAQMDAFAKFALELTYPPNPIAPLDNSLTPTLQQALDLYNNVTSDTLTQCNGCHVLDPANGMFGTDGTMSFEGGGVAEDMKIPHLRNIYQKVGMFAENTQVSSEPFLGPQIRGFGYDNSGASGTVAKFLSAEVFTLTAQQRALVEQLTLAFPSEMNPIVGQQVTVTPANRTQSDVNARVNLLVQRALVTSPRRECELVAKGVVQDEAVGWVMNGDEVFVADDGASGGTLQDLLTLVESESTPLTFTCAPPGNGTRIGVDRDADGTLDRNE